MKRLSIKSRVALWYAFSFLLIILLVGALLLAAGDSLIIKERKSILTSVTDRALEDVRIIQGTLSIDNDIDYYSDGVYVVLCQDNGTLLSGLEPAGFPESTIFEADHIRKIKNEDSSFYVYDRLIENQKIGKIWVRGITSARLQDIAPSAIRMLTGFLVALPILFLIAMAGGWLLTRQAFYPLTRIIDTAEKIRQDGTLDQRIGLGNPEDSDEIKRTAAIFDEMMDQIEKDFEMEKQFTNDASHELRTPISVILAESEYLLQNLSNNSEMGSDPLQGSDPLPLQESLLEIHSQAKQMSSLVSQLLAIARADRHIDQLKRELTDISLLAEEAADRYYTEAQRREIRLEVVAEECCYMDCDPVFMRQVFDNLIDNSLKYGKAGGKTILTVYQDQAGIHVIIEDDGIGMAAEELPRIWERFYRIHPVCTPDSANSPMSVQSLAKEDQARSMGLGLPMVKWIVEAHGGSISVDSEPGLGSSFHLLFPVSSPVN